LQRLYGCAAGPFREIKQILTDSEESADTHCFDQGWFHGVLARLEVCFPVPAVIFPKKSAQESGCLLISTTTAFHLAWNQLGLPDCHHSLPVGLHEQ
jgi:hypothetical protein